MYVYLSAVCRLNPLQCRKARSLNALDEENRGLIMGMDVIGKNPTSDVGSYFLNTTWWWTPLAEYCSEVAPEIAGKCTYWHSNDGDGLSEGHSRMLANILQNEIDSGRTEAYARRRQLELATMPNEPCDSCHDIGTPKPTPDCATGDLSKSGMTCNQCDEKGHHRPWPAEHVFCVQNVQRFANFLRACGGFEIW